MSKKSLTALILALGLALGPSCSRQSPQDVPGERQVFVVGNSRKGEACTMSLSVGDGKMYSANVTLDSPVGYNKRLKRNIANYKARHDNAEVELEYNLEGKVTGIKVYILDINRGHRFDCYEIKDIAR